MISVTVRQLYQSNKAIFEVSLRGINFKLYYIVSTSTGQEDIAVLCHTLPVQRIKFNMKGGQTMKGKIHTKNIFKVTDAEKLKKAVTEKVEKLMNTQLKKAV